jgi:glycosyltransferase involved in cell wall biosynthesis
MITNPKITVLMPAYNVEKYIGKAIESVLDQTFMDFELVIVNDGSTDGTVDIINSFSDPRIILINQENKGVATALNTGLAVSQAEYVARFDADDICDVQRLQKQYNFLRANPDYILVGSDADYILENDDFLFHFKCIAHTHDEIMGKLYFYCPFVHPTVMFKKVSVIEAGGYPAGAHNFEDYMLWTAISKAGKLYNLPEPLIKYRLNPTSVTIDERWRGKRFRQLKRKAIYSGHISENEGNELLAIIKNQDVRHIKEGSYHALCGKKFLANNYQPAKARAHVKKAITIRPLRLDNYLLYTVSYLPEKFILWLHSMSPNRL